MTETGNAAQPAKIANDTLNQLFRQARTHSAWLPKRVPAEVLREVYELARWGPTSANSTPARFAFLESEAAKARLLPALSPGNVEKTKAAPVTVIVAWDTEFYEKLPQLFPQADMRSYFVGLFNIMQEGDVQIKGYPVRLPLDLLLVFTANPEDYTARGDRKSTRLNSTHLGISY